MQHFRYQFLQVAAPHQRAAGGKERGAEHCSLVSRQFLLVAFGVGDEGFHQRQFQFPDGLVIGGVEVCFLPTIHHVPKEVQTRKAAGFVLHQQLVDSHRKRQAAFQHHLVGGNRREDVVHPGKGAYHALAVHRAGKVEEHDVGLVVRSGHVFIGGGYRLFGRTAQYRVGFLAQPGELLIRHALVFLIGGHRFGIPLSHPGDGMLRVVAIHHRHIVAFEVVEAACRQHGEGGLADPALLGGEGDIKGCSPVFHIASVHYGLMDLLIAFSQSGYMAFFVSTL